MSINEAPYLITFRWNTDVTRQSYKQLEDRAASILGREMPSTFVEFQPMHKGKSACPICSREWTVTPLDDCLLPICGCYGSDTSADNPYRPCQDCGIKHAETCGLEEGEGLE